MSLTPAFVPWAAIAFTLLLIVGALAWMVTHEPVAALLRVLWPADGVAGWLAYAAAYHLAFFTTPARAALLGGLAAVWGLCGWLGFWLLLRLAPGPARRRDVLFALAVLGWALVAAAGFRYTDAVSADRATLASHGTALLTASAAQAPPLRRVLDFPRLPANARSATMRALADAAAGRLTDAQLASFRLQVLPVLLEYYDLRLARLHSYQWVQVALIAVLLLVWGYGLPVPSARP